MEFKEVVKLNEEVRKNRASIRQQIEASTAKEAELTARINNPGGYMGFEELGLDKAAKENEQNRRAVLNARLAEACTPEDGSAIYSCLEAKRENMYRKACDEIMKYEAKIEEILQAIANEDRAIMDTYNESKNLAPVPGKYAIMHDLNGRGVYNRTKRYIDNMKQIKNNIYC